MQNITQTSVDNITITILVHKLSNKPNKLTNKHDYFCTQYDTCSINSHILPNERVCVCVGGGEGGNSTNTGDWIMDYY